MATALAVAIIIGLVFFLPSGVLNLRVQEGIFPIVAVGYMVGMALVAYAGLASGLFLLVVILLAVLNFTPGAWDVMQYAIVMCGFYLLLVSMRWEIMKRKAVIYNVVCSVALLNVVWLALQRMGVFLFFYPRGSAETLSTGLFANQNEVSVFLAMALPCFMRAGWRWLMPLVIAGLVLAQTANGIVAAICIGIVLILRWCVGRYPVRRVVLVCIASMVLGLGIIQVVHPVIGEDSTNQRIAAWTRALPLAAEKPLLGWGLGQGKYILPLYLNAREVPKRYAAAMYERVSYRDDLKALFAKNIPPESNEIRAAWTHLHNEYLQWWVEAGALGMGALVLLIWAHGFFFLRTRDRDWVPALGILAALCTACFFFTFQIGRLLFLAVLYAAMVQSAYLDRSQQGDS